MSLKAKARPILNRAITTSPQFDNTVDRLIVLQTERRDYDMEQDDSNA